MDNIEIYAAALSEEDFNRKYDTSYSWEDEWKIDFGPKDSPQWEAYTMMYNTTVYKPGGVAQSYGFKEEIDAYETYVNTDTLSITFWGDESLGKDAVTGALNSLEIKKISDEYPEPKATAAATKAAAESAGTDSAPAKNGDTPWIPVGIGVLVIIAGAVAAIYFRKKKKN